MAPETAAKYWSECVKNGLEEMRVDHIRRMNTDPEYRRQQEEWERKWARKYEDAFSPSPPLPERGFGI
jgi:hypothetical protein